MINAFFVQMAVMFLPVVVFVVAVEITVGLRKSKKLRKPSADKMLRAPGESLRRKLEELDWELFTWASGMMTSATVAGVFANQAYSQAKSVQAVPMHPGVLVTLSVGLYCIWKMLSLLKQRRNDRLGLSGELAVGEELNKLMLDGCRVYHDFPGGAGWNIDHIIVSFGGVFAVETKAFSKKESSRRMQKDHEVIYTGDTLEFPEWSTKEPIEQARTNARELANFLKKAAAEDVPVFPMTVPIGWYVISKVGGPQEVLNVKWVRRAVLDRPYVLTDAQLKRICHQIEQKCRDVEF